jgi:hypothetical protein
MTTLIKLHNMYYFRVSLETLKKNRELQKRAIRLTYNTTSTTTCKPHLKKFNIVTVPCVCVCV